MIQNFDLFGKDNNPLFKYGLFRGKYCKMYFKFE